MLKGRGKFFLTLGGVTVLVAGVFIGAFLVLRSETSQGKLYSISNPAAKSTQELLSELYQIQDQTNRNDFGWPQNLTDDFLTTISREGSKLGLKPSDYGSDDFFYGTVLPYLHKNQEELFPFIPTSRLVVDDSVNRRTYARSLKPYFNIFESTFEYFGEIPKKFPDPLDPDLVQELSIKAAALSKNFEVLLTLPVPGQYAEFHQQVLQFSLALQKTLENLANASEDPLRALLAINQVEDVAAFAEQVFAKYSKL